MRRRGAACASRDAVSCACVRLTKARRAYVEVHTSQINKCRAAPRRRRPAPALRRALTGRCAVCGRSARAAPARPRSRRWRSQPGAHTPASLAPDARQPRPTQHAHGARRLPHTVQYYLGALCPSSRRHPHAQQPSRILRRTPGRAAPPYPRAPPIPALSHGAGRARAVLHGPPRRHLSATLRSSRTAGRAR